MSAALNTAFVVQQLNFAFGRIRVTQNIPHVAPTMADADLLIVHLVAEAPASLNGVWAIMSLGRIPALARASLLSSSIWMGSRQLILLLPPLTQVHSR
jgi:hypothetical protein